MLADARAAPWVDGIAYHCYFGDPSRQSELHEAFPGAEIYFTECSGSHGPTDPPQQVFSDTLKWHARNLVLGVTRNWSRTVINRSLALDPSGRPHVGGCDTCTGVVTVGPGQTVTRNAEYDTLGYRGGAAAERGLLLFRRSHASGLAHLPWLSPTACVGRSVARLAGWWVTISRISAT